MVTTLFGDILGEADRVTVVDVETTGFSNSDRVIEVAVVTLDRHGRTVDEFETLLDPGRSPGPSWVHRISASMLQGAPSFADAAALLGHRLHGAVFCAHNIPFDRRMLDNEFARCDIAVDWGVGIDTLRLTGAKLSVACDAAGISIPQAHRALHDARATAALLCSVAAEITTSHRAMEVPAGVPVSLPTLTRDGPSLVHPIGPTI